jgi:predicted transcriptional regulator of viral defense system
MTPPSESVEKRLAALSEKSRAGLVGVDEAVAAWRTSRNEAAARLARLADATWLTRLRRGLYYVVPLDAASGEVTTYPDPWVLASVAYSPCYIGGWSAAEHWGLTEQLFRGTFVVTAANIRARRQLLLGLEFTLAKVRPARLPGVPVIWRGSERVAVSSAERTIVDGLRDPSWIGGVRHLVRCLGAFLEPNPRERLGALVAEMARSGNGAAAKRLGFLLETSFPDARHAIDLLHPRITQGLIRLDPGIRRTGRINKRWGLRVNARLD